VDSAKREAIIAAATRAFFESGFAGTSIERVAADAGVSKVTVYSHFGDKRALFTAAIEAACSQIRDHFTIDEPVNGTLRTRLLAIGEALVAFLSRPEMVQFERRIAAETVNEPEIGATFLAAGPHRMKEALSEFLRACARAWATWSAGSANPTTRRATGPGSRARWRCSAARTAASLRKTRRQRSAGFDLGPDPTRGPEACGPMSAHGPSYQSASRVLGQPPGDANPLKWGSRLAEHCSACCCRGSLIANRLQLHLCLYSGAANSSRGKP
jgi:AcrR family transcriptional regulator